MNTLTHNGQKWRVTSCGPHRLVAVPLLAEAAAEKAAAALRARREKLSLSTRDMAARLGISQSMLVKLERAKLKKSLPGVLAKALKIKL